MKKPGCLIAWIAGIPVVSFVIAFIWRVFVTVDIPLTDYPFATIFQNALVGTVLVFIIGLAGLFRHREETAPDIEVARFVLKGDPPQGDVLMRVSRRTIKDHYHF